MVANRRVTRDEGGFTLVELVVVILILSVLVAIALAAFVSARTRSEDRVAQVAARQAFTVVKVMASDGDLARRNDRPYADSVQIVATLAREESNLQWVTMGAPSTGPTVVSASSADQAYLDANQVGVRHAFAVESETSICWMMGELLDGSIEYRSLPAGSATPCAAQNFLAATNHPGGW